MVALITGGIRRWIWQTAVPRTMLVIGGLLGGLLVAEIGFRVREKMQAPVDPHSIEGVFSPIPDERLGHRMAPYTHGNDAKGFRNDTVPHHVDIVAIGDSQTWGTSVSRSEAWPQTLARISSLSVYNMGVGGYGPVQYLALTDDALTLFPRIIVVGVYFGNDLYDAYRMVYGNRMYAHLRAAKGANKLLTDTIIPKLNELDKEWALARQAPTRWPQWFTRSAVVRFLLRTNLWTTGDAVRRDKAWALAHPDHGTVYESTSVPTLLTPAYRLLAVDLNEPRIAEGVRITKETLVKLQSKSKMAGVRLIVLLIPTKESVYASELEPRHLNETFSRLLQMEARARGAIMESCVWNKVDCIDALPTLREAIRNGERIYPEDENGHPSPRGNFRLALIVYDALVKIGLVGLPSKNP